MGEKVKCLMGLDSSKFGNFDTDLCASISGPQKCWFWSIFPKFLGPKIDFSFFWLFSGSTDSSSRPLLAPINPGLTWN